MKQDPNKPVDTIVALSTPYGCSGIGVIRMSGPEAIPILLKIFRSMTETEFPDRTAIYGTVFNPREGNVLDDGLALVMRGPHSYTGEDVVELSLHGSPTVLEMVTHVIVEHGARHASRGEFTRRAFLFGRMDLVQAEAVIDLIDAKTASAALEARSRMDKRLSAEILEISDALKDVMAKIEAYIDFDEEEESSAPQTEHTIREVFRKIEALKARARAGRIRREGIVTVITGKPNVGKSTLFNLLLNKERTIVTPYPGTTRDPVDDCLVLGGTAFVLWDTAGIRQHPDPVEEEGILRTKDIIGEADLVIVVFDGSKPPDGDDTIILEACKKNQTLAVVNKMDLVKGMGHSFSTELTGAPNLVAVSAKTHEGIEALKSVLSDFGKKIVGEISPTTQGASLNARCLELMEAVSMPIKRLLTRFTEEGTILPEIISYELRTALGPLEEITGERADDGVLDRIFERFCVGK